MASAGVMPVSDVGNIGSGAVAGSLITGALAWLAQRRRAESDVEVAVLNQWQKLNGALSDRLTAVERDFAEYRSEMSKSMADLRSKHAAEIDQMREQHRTEIDEMRRQHRTEMKAMRELNEGLQRQIAQNSQSTAQLITKSPEGDAP